MSDEQRNHRPAQTEIDTGNDADVKRWRYRLTIHRIAHARLRDELDIGLSGRLATWVALRETTAHCALSPTESAHLLASLQSAAGQTDPRP